MKPHNWKLATALVVCSAALAATAAIDANLYLSDVKYLSSKDLKGRMTGSPELVNGDPYGAGWMVRLKVSAPDEIRDLLDPTAYDALIKAG